MHSPMRDGGIEHVRLLVRKRRTPTEADGNEKKQDAEKTLHAREKHLTRIRPNYSAFKGGIIRSNPLAFGGTARHKRAHDERSDRTRGFLWQAQKLVGRNARCAQKHARDFKQVKQTL